jgi:hypothetical protein
MWVTEAIAREVASSLNNASFSESFKSEFKYSPVTKIDQMKDLIVTVNAIEQESQGLLTRSMRVQELHTVMVVVQKSISNPDDDSVIGRYAELCQEIEAHLRQQKSLSPLGVNVCVYSTSQVGHVPESIATASIFNGFVILSYTVTRE